MRLINADALMEMNFSVTITGEDNAIKVKRLMEQYNKAIINAPTIDAEPVVHCKDCRWYDKGYGFVCHNPRYGDGYANYSPPYVDEDYWCKDGEHKGGDTK